MEFKEKILEVLELADELSTDCGMQTSVEFFTYGRRHKGVETCKVTILGKSDNIVTTIGESYENFESSLDFCISLLKDTIKFAEVRHG